MRFYLRRGPWGLSLPWWLAGIFLAFWLAGLLIVASFWLLAVIFVAVGQAGWHLIEYVQERRRASSFTSGVQG